MSFGFLIIALKKVLIKEKLKYTEKESEQYTTPPVLVTHLSARKLLASLPLPMPSSHLPLFQYSSILSNFQAYYFIRFSVFFFKTKPKIFSFQKG